jgi:hypothetical protein
MVSLRIPRKDAVLRLQERIDAIDTLRENPHGLEYYDVIGWCSRTWAAIDAIYGEGEIHPEEIRLIGLPGCTCRAEQEGRMLAGIYRSRLQEYIREIRRDMQMGEPDPLSGE